MYQNSSQTKLLSFTHKTNNNEINLKIPVSPSLMRSDFPFLSIVTPPMLIKKT